MPERPLWEKVLETFGFNVTQLKWRYRRWTVNRERKQNEIKNQRRTLRYQHKICRSCGLTVDKGERTCPRCQSALPSARLERLQRYWRLVFPEGAYSYTLVFTALHTALYLVMVMQSVQGGVWGGPDVRTAVRFGAWSIPAMLVQHQWWRLVTAMFLHLGGLHILGNSIALVQIGPLVEQCFGRSRFLFLYFVSGLGGFVLSVSYRIVAKEYGGYGAGASGALFGLLGAALVLGYIRRSPTVVHFRDGLFRWALLGLAISLAPGIDLLGHLGGAVTGAGLASFLAVDRAPRGRSKVVWLLVEVGCVYAVCQCFVLAIISWPR